MPNWPPLSGAGSSWLSIPGVVNPAISTSVGFRLPTLTPGWAPLHLLRHVPPPVGAAEGSAIRPSSSICPLLCDPLPQQAASARNPRAASSVTPRGAPSAVKHGPREAALYLVFS